MGSPVESGQPSAPRSSLPTFTTTLVTTQRELDRVIGALRSLRWVALDCEATGLDPRTATPLLLQLGIEGRVNVVVLPAFDDEPLAALMAALQGKTVLGHNLNYDYRLLREHYADVAFTHVFDTMLAEQLLTCGGFDEKKSWLKQLSLAAVVDKHLGLTLDKEQRLTFTEVVPDRTWRPTSDQVHYAALDVALLPSLVKAQDAKLRENLLMPAARLRFNALVPLAEVELRGMCIDQVAWRAYLKELEAKQEQLETELRTRLQPYETAYRLGRYEEELGAFKVWEAARDAEVDRLRDEFHSGYPIQFGVEKWGDWKNQGMKAWREAHPNPGKPKLDPSPMNLGSHDQVLRAYQDMGLAVDSVDKKTRDRLLLEPLDDEVRQTLELHGEFSLTHHFIKSFGENILALIVPETGRLHTHYNIGLTETGRMSSENPNFQNMPRDETIRHAFIADPGTKVLTADFSGQELAIAAALSGDAVMTDDLNEGRDLYKELASRVWRIPVDQVSKQQRQHAKSAVLGINYGLGVKGLMARHHMSEADARALLRDIKKRYSTLVAWGDQQVFKAKEEGHVRTASGAWRRFPDVANMDWKVNTEARNMPIQGTAADIVYRLAWRAETYLVPKGILPVNYVHDELVCLVPGDMDENEAAWHVEQQMEAAFYDLLPYETYGVKVGADVHVEKFWSKG